MFKPSNIKIYCAKYVILAGIILVGFVNPVQSQFRKGQKVISFRYQTGTILQHRKTIAHLIINNPVGFLISFDGKTHGLNAWEVLYNYPDIGLAFVYVDFRNQILGKTIALIPHYNIYIRKNTKARYQVSYKVGLGISYSTNTYDREFNNKNNVISTKINFGILFEIQQSYAITDNLLLANSINMTHFSNGAIKLPNLGINVLNLNIGFSYLLGTKPDVPNNQFPASPLKKKPGFIFSLASGIHEPTVESAGKHPFFVLTGMIDRHLNEKSVLGAGFEWFYSVALKKYRDIDFRLDPDDIPDFNRIGLVLSHELMINEYSVITQAGYYIYDPYKYFSPIYLRAGLRRYFGKNVFGTIAVKAHGPTAESAEIFIGYKL